MTNGHPYREEDFELYALGVMEGEERAGIEKHIGMCVPCAGKLAMARGRVAVLSLPAETVAPPANVKQRLMEKIHAEKTAQPAETPAQPAQEERIPAHWWTLAWATTAFALAAVAIIFWVKTNELKLEIQNLQSLAAHQNTVIERTHAIAALLTSPQTISVNLAPQPPAATEPGRVFYNAQLGALIYAGSLPQLESGKSYELWLIPPSGNPLPAGVFAPKPNGDVEVVLPKIPAGVSAKAFAVTIEPAGGAPSPTGEKVQVGQGL